MPVGSFYYAITNVKHDNGTQLEIVYIDGEEELEFKAEEIAIEELKDIITGIRNVRAKMNVHPSKKSKLIFVTTKYKKLIKNI